MCMYVYRIHADFTHDLDLYAYMHMSICLHVCTCIHIHIYTYTYIPHKKEDSIACVICRAARARVAVIVKNINLFIFGKKMATRRNFLPLPNLINTHPRTHVCTCT